jgi:uncharacterized protein (TIGR02598 family)
MTSRNKAGFSLVEVVLALGIGSFCLIALLGLLSVGLKSDIAATEETTAINIATALINDLQTTPKVTGVTGTSTLYQLALPASGSVSNPAAFIVNQVGQVPKSGDPTGRYLVTVTMTAPQNGVSGAGQVQPVFVDIRISWPVAASLQNAVGSMETFTALDRW